MGKAEIEPDQLYAKLKQAWIRVSTISRSPAERVKTEPGMPVTGILTLCSHPKRMEGISNRSQHSFPLCPTQAQNEDSRHLVRLHLVRLCLQFLWGFFLEIYVCASLLKYLHVLTLFPVIGLGTQMCPSWVCSRKMPPKASVSWWGKEGREINE